MGILQKKGILSALIEIIDRLRAILLPEFSLTADAATDTGLWPVEFGDVAVATTDPPVVRNARYEQLPSLFVGRENPCQLCQNRGLIMMGFLAGSYS